MSWPDSVPWLLQTDFKCDPPEFDRCIVGWLQSIFLFQNGYSTGTTLDIYNKVVRKACAIAHVRGILELSAMPVRKQAKVYRETIKAFGYVCVD